MPVPYDTRKPFDPSGIRLGTPALTTRGMGESEMREVARLFAEVVHEPESESVRRRVKQSVAELAARFPLYPKRIKHEAMSAD